MVVPPETGVQCESKILGREAVWNGLSRDTEGSGGMTRVLVKKMTCVFAGLKVRPQVEPLSLIHI